jgi:uncharacterized protein (DUF2252 family)
MQQTSVWERIQAFDRGGRPECLSLKYFAMQQDIVAYLRNTTHLFYEDLSRDELVTEAPLAWINGDLHLENFGSYKGDNRLTYFDVYAFDEAALAPCIWDLARFLCSLLVGCQALGIEHSRAYRLCENFLQIYCRELKHCKSSWIERSQASGMIRDSLKNLKRRKRPELLFDFTVSVDDKIQLKKSDQQILGSEEQQKISRLIERFATEQHKPEFFKVLDSARYADPDGSWSDQKYIILVEGKGAGRHFLMEVNYQPGSCLIPYLSTPQPEWNNQAERVVALQYRGQAVASAFLSPVMEGELAYLIQEWMPPQDKLQLRNWHGKLQRLKKTVHSMAQLTAWLHLRSSGWRGAALADEFQDFGSHKHWHKPLLDYALAYSRQMRLDWLSFKEDSGAGSSDASD